MNKKIQEGATVAFSQPIFEYAVLEEFLERTKHLRFHFILGIIPLRSLRHAEFLHYEVPGMVVPDWVRKTIADNSHTIEHAAAKGMEIARTLLQKAKKDIAGVYIMPPAKKYSMAVEIIQSL
ncbi:MAG: methylenetetrahydrofolate reductase [Ignavibacteria bacterium]|nr:methylenetetrahydrofolate reductase [Ignavibacteria bacterium]